MNYTSSQIAAHFDISAQTVSGLTRKDGCPAHKDGRTWHWPEPQKVEAWLWRTIKKPSPDATEHAELKIDDAIAALNFHVPGVHDETDIPYVMLTEAALAEAERTIDRVRGELRRSVISQRVDSNLAGLIEKLKASYLAQEAAVASTKQ